MSEKYENTVRFREGPLKVEDLKSWRYLNKRGLGRHRNMRAILLCPELRFAYIVNGKSASTTIRRTFKKSFTQHLWFDNRYDLVLYDDFIERVTNKELAKFKVVTAVRNPYDRFVSGFCYFTGRAKGHNKNSKWWKHGSFEDFVDRRKVWFNKNLRVYLHLRQQHYCTHINGVCVVDDVARVENLQEGFDRWCNMIGLTPVTLPRSNPSVRRKSYREYYNDKTKRIVTKLYKKDLELFGYTF